jgi:hypothetical protein
MDIKNLSQENNTQVAPPAGLISGESRHPSPDVIWRYVCGELPPEEMARLDPHIEFCALCLDEVEEREDEKLFRDCQEDLLAGRVTEYIPSLAEFQALVAQKENAAQAKVTAAAKAMTAAASGLVQRLKRELHLFADVVASLPLGQRADKPTKNKSANFIVEGGATPDRDFRIDIFAQGADSAGQMFLLSFTEQDKQSDWYWETPAQFTADTSQEGMQARAKVLVSMEERQEFPEKVTMNIQPYFEQ